MVVHGIGSITFSLLSKRPLIQWTRGYSTKKASAFTAQLKSILSSFGEEGTHAAAKPVSKKRRRTKPKAVAPTASERAVQEPKLSELNTQGWSGETWKEDWGEDKLRAASSSVDKRAAPPHITFPIAYSRRIEGLLEDTPKTVLQDLTPLTRQNPIATLHHGLERVLFNPGVHWMRDPRSRVYNYHPSLSIIPKVEDFGFERLTGFIRSSRDQDLWGLAKREGRKFGGSTSSLSGMLCHIYFLLSGNKSVDTNILSSDFRREAPTFTPGQRMAASVVFNHNDGVYSIDSDPAKDGDSDKNILIWMGTLLEKYLTSSTEDFLPYMRSHPASEKITPEEPVREAYRYSKSEKFVLRSQLDCYDPRLPGTGVFDIKTRAVLPIRMDILNFKESSGYLIRYNNGFYESFEREYYDLIRSAFLKYQFQARIGNMDGVFVAYHNTARIFGFQYVPLVEMDQRLFGTAPGAGDRVFQKCMETLELVSEEIISCFPGQSVKCTFETEDGIGKDMNVWVEPLDWEPPKGEAGKVAPVRPIKQIVVSAASFYGNFPAKGGRCVGAMDQTWTVHWSITRLSSDSDTEDQIRSGLAAAKGRQFRVLSIPTGVTPETIEEWWDSLDFNGSKKVHVPLTPLGDDGSEGIEVEISEAEDPPIKPSRSKTFFLENFAAVEPGSRVQDYRDLAISGRQETIRIGLEDRGKPKLLLGVGEVEWEDTLAEEEIAAHIRAEEAEKARLENAISEPDEAETVLHDENSSSSGRTPT